MATYISRTLGTPTDNKKWTFSAWFKITDQSASDRGVMSIGGNTSEYTRLNFDGSHQLEYDNKISGASWDGRRYATAKRTDPGAWYHVVAVFDSDNGTPADRMITYFNGERISAYTNSIDPSSGAVSGNTSGETVRIGVVESTAYFNGVMSWVQFVDGLALAPTEFGEVDSTSGIWKIKAEVYGTPGNNGFCLKMEDRTNLDLDSSSNAHTFTTTGTGTATYDSPSNNFCTMNPLDNYYAGSTFSKGNNTVATTQSAYTSNTGTLGVGAGKWYYEFKNTGASGTNQSRCGWNAIIATSATDQSPGRLTPSVGLAMNNGDKSTDGSGNSSYGSAIAEGDLVRCAIDIDNNKAWFGNSAGWFDSGDPAAGTNAITITAPDSTTSAMGVYTPSYGDQHDGETGYIGEFNFGNGYFGTTAVSSTNADDAGIGSFEFDVPTGFYALCTKNIKAYGG